MKHASLTDDPPLLHYQRSSAVVGSVTSGRECRPVGFRRLLSAPERAFLLILTLVGLLSGGALVLRLATSKVPAPPADTTWVPRALALSIAAVEAGRLLQVGSLAWFAWRAVDPIPMSAPSGLRVALVTTIVPDREPLSVVASTLRAMRQVQQPGGPDSARAWAARPDVWILDEGDDVEVRNLAKEIGVRHFTRKGRPEYNQAAGPMRTRTKAGNHNAWRAEHEAAYDVVAQMDPDHVPLPMFLHRTLGYFRDPDVAFVVAPQVYGNLRDGLVQHAAAAQSFVFAGVIQRGGNGLGAPLLIGTNHVYRTSAWAAIGGYQDSLIEDHLTGLTVSGAVNPATGNRWKGVYTPDIVAVGEAPTSWADFFRQQRRWAYGVADIVLRHSARLLPRLAPRQAIAYLLLESFYPGCAVTWGLGNLATVAYLLGATRPSLAWWWVLVWGLTFGTGLGLLVWLRRCNVADHERSDRGLHGIFASCVCGPVYLAAVVTAVLRRPMSYAVTPKGALRSTDGVATFRQHLSWAALATCAVAIHLRSGGRSGPVVVLWALFTVVICCCLPLALLLRRAGSSRAGPLEGGRGVGLGERGAVDAGVVAGHREHLLAQHGDS